MSRDRYSGDILRGHARRQTPNFPDLQAEPGLVLEVVGEDFVGALIDIDKTFSGYLARLEDRYGNRRVFPIITGGFLHEGQRVNLSTKMQQPQPQTPTHSNSGSRRVENLSASVAAPSRIWVEGVHDAALVEKIWGHDLRVEGVVVEYLEGLDNLEERLTEFQPTAQRRIGVLADHLIAGTKEARLTENVGPHVLVTGHPYVDIWEAVKPARVGLAEWPHIPRGQDWKTGVCEAVGWSNPKEAWHRIYNSVHTFRDVDISLIGAVERLVDFVTNPELQKSDLL
ncbi:DUF3097 domain-containing protein [Corynebacterium sp. MNWGS58]|uniref:DUF3097 domain-containing protein n=1 Tax=Corynebacterium sp. 102791.4 TaxID=3104612 RepID=UPI003510D38B